MKQRLIVCAAESRFQASRILDHLIHGGFDRDAISILFANKNNSDNSPGKKHASGASTFAARASAGALLGGAFVWLSGLGTLSVPGVGPLIVAGVPLITAMGQFTSGGMPDMLAGMGLSKSAAAFYAARVGQGNILISVSVTGTMEAIAAKAIIQATGLRDISDTADEAMPLASAACESIATNNLEFSGSC